MKLIHIFAVVPLLCACEKVWEADLREKALDTIRGVYEIESAVWEGQESLDINGYGNATFDYYSEYLSIDVGTGDFTSYINNKSANIRIPVITDSNNGWYGPVSLMRDAENVMGKTNVIIEGDSSRVEITFDKDIGYKQTGYGEFTVRTEVTATDYEGRTSTAPVAIKFRRIRYLGK
jgi:pantothenate kinase